SPRSLSRRAPGHGRAPPGLAPRPRVCPFSFRRHPARGRWYHRDTLVEQRRYARAPIDAPLTFTVKGKNDWKDGTGKDVSIGGMSIETTEVIPFGADVEVSVQLPGDDDIFLIPGVVRWARDGRIGVQFGMLGAR